MDSISAGFAEVEFTPEPGLELRGQHFRRVAERVRDPLMANAVALRCGEETVVFVSVDICFLPTEFVTALQDEFHKRTGIPNERLLLHSTHSHVAPITMGYYWGTPDPAFMERLRQAILGVAEQALNRLEPVTLFSGSTQLEHLGWNRRGMYEDGSSAMHADPRRPGFIGSEGPRDPNFGVLFARNTGGRITGLIASFQTHPNCVDSERYYSADLPGEFRRLLKEELSAPGRGPGPCARSGCACTNAHKGLDHGDPAVVYLTGPCGNATPRILEPYLAEQPWMGEEGLLRSGAYMAEEAAKVIADAEPVAGPGLRFEHREVPIPIRPFPQPGERCYPASWSEESMEHYRRQEADWPRRMREESPVGVRLNVVRLGDTVICTNPAELFVEFGLKMREASPARVTILAELTDGHVGYVPTPLAFSRGGYETWPSQTSRLVPEAGDMIADTTAEMLRKAFKE